MKAEITVEVRELSKQPGLGTILVGEDPGSKAYVDGKHKDCAEVGINSIRINLPATAKTADILKAVKDLNQNPECSGFIVQLPLPDGVNTEEILLAIDPKKMLMVCTQ